MSGIKTREQQQANDDKCVWPTCDILLSTLLSKVLCFSVLTVIWY